MIHPAPRHAHKDPATDLRIQSDWVREFGPKLWITLGIDDPDASIRRAEALMKVGKVGGFIVDPLIGFSKANARMIKMIKREFGKGALVMAGNVCVPEGVLYLIEAGADCIKIGMGPGAACTTRGVTGVGVPQFTAVLECAAMANRYGIPSIADGGIEGPRAVALALAAGAWAVMSGKLFTQCKESPAEKRRARKNPDEKRKKRSGEEPPQFEAHYMGLASAAYQEWRGRKSSRTVPEGVDFWTPVKYTVDSLMDTILGGLKSTMSQCAVWNIAEFRKKKPVVRFYVADHASVRESGTRVA
ncbi:MAG: IMP dehydrogenase [Deltaproteobacteria bacterium]|nr:IMP dehydrogenase [Deltaproteobacteria bacterium]